VNSPQKFLLVQLGRLGDFILATPILRALKQDNPQHQIHVLASRHNALLARDHPLVDKVLIHSKKMPALLPLLLRFKCEQYDYWIDPKDHFSRESYFFARWARARCKIGFNPEGKRPAFDVTVPSAQANYEDQVAVRNLRALQSLPLQSADPRPVLFLKPRDEENLQEFLRQANLSRYVCVHLSASKEIRYWPQAHWIAFLQAVSLPAFSFVVTCSPADAARAQEIVATVPRAGLDDRLVDLEQVVGVGATGVLGRELDLCVAPQGLTTVADPLHGLGQGLLAIHPELVLEVDVARGDEHVEMRALGHADRLDGTLVSANRRGEEKARCVRELLGGRYVSESFAYGNSASDLPHLKLVKHGLLVNGNSAARRQAARLGVACVDWT